MTLSFRFKALQHRLQKHLCHVSGFSAGADNQLPAPGQFSGLQQCAYSRRDDVCIESTDEEGLYLIMIHGSFFEVNTKLLSNIKI